jgi:hypothetical protein
MTTAKSVTAASTRSSRSTTPLYACLDRMLWKEAVERTVLTHLNNTNNLARLKSFLELSADVEVSLPAFKITGIDRHKYPEFKPTPRSCSSLPIWTMSRWRVSYQRMAPKSNTSTGTARTNSAPCILRGRPSWCSCSWTTTLTRIGLMTSNVHRCTGMPSATTSRPCGRFSSTARTSIRLRLGESPSMKLHSAISTPWNSWCSMKQM